MFWLSLFYSSSITTTLIIPHPEAVADPFAIVGCQEPPLEEWVLSNWRRGTLLRSPDPNPLIIVLLLYHRHLSPLIKSTISLHSSSTVTVLSQTLHVYLPDSHLYLSTYQLFLCSAPCSPPLLCSTVSTLCCSLWIPWNWKRIDYSQIRPKIHCHYPINHLDSLPCFLSPALVQ